MINGLDKVNRSRKRDCRRPKPRSRSRISTGRLSKRTYTRKTETRFPKGTERFAISDDLYYSRIPESSIHPDQALPGLKATLHCHAVEVQKSVH